jgi:hypothetical protein
MVALLLAVLATHAGAQETSTTPPGDDAKAQADPEAVYTADITKRANDVIAFAGIEADKADRVREVLVNQYRSLRTVHDARDAKLKSATDDAAKASIKSDADASLKKLHDDFVAKLSADLTPQQVEKVKDKLTYNVVNVTYDAYCDELPQLTDAQKTYIRAQLVEAREIAMDQGSSKDKHAVFGKYKGRINNYLAKEGYDMKAAEKDWAARRKARAAATAATKAAASK